MIRLILIVLLESFVCIWSWTPIGRKEDGFNYILGTTQTQLHIENQEKTRTKIETTLNI